MMDHDDDFGIGRRISEARKIRRMSQYELAARIPFSLSMLRKVEQGKRDATPAFTAAVAKCLATDVTTLTGQPYDQRGRSRDRIHTAMPGLRQALTYWDLSPQLDRPIGSWAALRAQTVMAAELRRTAQHLKLVQTLPDLLLEVTAAAHESPEAKKARYFELLAILLFAAHSVTYKTGYLDLSSVVEDRITWVASRSSDPLMGALAAWARTTSMLQNGSYRIGLQLLDRMQAEIRPTRTDQEKTTLPVSGSLHLRSGMLAARAGDDETANAHLREAGHIAAHLGGDDHDGGWHQLSFGPANVSIHEVAARIELGDGAGAVSLARDLRIPPSLPPIRAGHHFVDLSRAQLWEGEPEAALKSLYQARRLAPQQTRHLPTTREVLRMLVRTHRRSSEPLAKMVNWIGGDL
ncbi:transcriptional regulator [Actinoplanes sp. NBRC 14428]|uniref:Helix-turn-helix protein n=1 Tax=Pseudosporangium ferrugineum TaxID=439699 RepID=A0A2T0RQ76_9ACTN|nr:helix-turn-helix transcriptional regulator [Pseudosporangium ferrugineum]PRY23328.1 helix-turn-helix protein [Pseudosporangium ferrugineum]BCJ55314.1 transcriptional regulator [Actinoplanes sp. NBRC 14428]